MKILVVTSEFPSNIAPQRASFNRQHLNALAENHAIRVVCPRPWQEYFASRNRKLRAPDLVTPDIEVDYVPYFYLPRLMLANRDWFMWLFVRRTLLQLCSEFQPDLILGIWAYPDGAVALRLAKAMKLPVVVQVLGSDVNLLDQYPAKRAKTISTLKNVDRVLTVSSALRDEVVRRGVSPDRVSVVYRGVNAELFQPREQTDARLALGLRADKRHLLFIGNLVPVKDPLLLLSSFMKAGLDSECELHFVGKGPLLQEMSSLIEGTASSNDVHFHGVVSHLDIPLWMAAADALVLSSAAEGVPNVLLEARCIGLPYIATRVGGVPEVSTHSDALLVDHGDVDGMCEAIVSLVRGAAVVRQPVSWQSWSEAGAILARELEHACHQFYEQGVG